MPDAAIAAELLDLRFARATMDAAVAQCLAWCAGPRVSHTVITANAAILCMMRKDRELRAACRAGDLVLADGMSVVWSLRAAATPVAGRVTGVDLMARLLEEGSARGLGAYFLGASDAVVRTLVAVCAERYPGLRVAGFRDGYFPPGDQAAIVEEIRALEPHLLFVGMPSPFKETFCERHRERLAVPVMIGVGGSFDVLSGRVRRAPRWVGAAGMEWAWRLMMEPRRLWKRYLTTNGEFVWRAGREVLARRMALLARGTAGAEVG